MACFAWYSGSIAIASGQRGWKYVALNVPDLADSALTRDGVRVASDFGAHRYIVPLDASPLKWARSATYHGMFVTPARWRAPNVAICESTAGWSELKAYSYFRNIAVDARTEFTDKILAYDGWQSNTGIFARDMPIEELDFEMSLTPPRGFG